MARPRLTHRAKGEAVIARFRLKPGGPKSLSAKGHQWHADRVHTTTDRSLFAWLRQQPAITILSVEGLEEQPGGPPPRVSAPAGIPEAKVPTGNGEVAEPSLPLTPNTKAVSKKKTTTRRKPVKRRARKS